MIDMGMMSTTAWVWTAAAFAVVVAAAIISPLFLREQHTTTTTKKQGKTKKKRRLVLPPGPKGLPIIGHLHLIGKNPHQDFQRLSQIHGPVMHLRFGAVDTIVASSADAAQLFLKTHDLNFVTRPSMRVADTVTYGKKGVLFGNYGPVWREMRKLYVTELLTSQKINSFESLRRRELGLLIESLKESAARGEAVDLSAKVASVNVNTSCMMLFGKKYEDRSIIGEEDDDDEMKGFMAVIDEATHLIGAINLGEYFPILDKLDVQGLYRRAKLVNKLFDKFFERIIVEHESTVKTTSSSPEDFVDIALKFLKNTKDTSFEFTREHVKSMMLDVLVATIDTSSTTIAWVLSELIRNQRVMKKVKEEIEREVGVERMVEEKDLEKLKYLDMVIKESFRLHPIGPLLLPRAAMDDCRVGDFDVPKNATVLINVWAMGRDPKAWSDPGKFDPERFEGSGVDHKGQHFELLPFGSGRRRCPGMQLGMTIVRLVVAQLVHCFEWDLPKGTLHEDLDMTEKYGLVMSRAHSLVAVPRYTLPAAACN